MAAGLMVGVDKLEVASVAVTLVVMAGTLAKGEGAIWAGVERAEVVSAAVKVVARLVVTKVGAA
jgi:hypothetical protein